MQVQRTSTRGWTWSFIFPVENKICGKLLHKSNLDSFGYFVFFCKRSLRISRLQPRYGHRMSSWHRFPIRRSVLPLTLDSTYSLHPIHHSRTMHTNDFTSIILYSKKTILSFPLNLWKCILFLSIMSNSSIAHHWVNFGGTLQLAATVWTYM